MSARGKKAANDPTRFEGNGVSFKAKLIGMEDVPEARGDQMCQEAITKLKNSVKISGEHKRKIFINVTLEGLKIIDAISLASNQNKKKNEPKSPKPGEPEVETPDKEQELIVLHTHAVHRISFISRDTTDNRAFGYIYGNEDGSHKFFAIKTAAAAEQLVLTLRDLFQVVYEMKKKEMDAAKEKLEKGEIDTEENKENSQTPGSGSTSGSGQTLQTKVNAETENIYQGIEQIKNLEFDAITSDTKSPVSSPPTSPLAKLSPPSSAASSTADPWGFDAPAASTAAPVSAAASSALGDLAGLQTGPFPTMGQQPFGTPFSMSGGMQGGFGAQTGFNMMGSGLPVTKDPFGNDPFGSSGQQPQIRPGGGFGAANPFAGGGFNQPYGMQGMQQGMPQGMVSPGMGPHGMMPGMVPHGMVSQQGLGMRNPFGAQQAAAPQMSNPFGGDDPNMLMPMKKNEGLDPNAASQEDAKARSKSPREDLFGDLLDIKKSAPPAAKNPKDMFAQINAPEKKSMNEMKKTAAAPPPAQIPAPAAQASDADADPFGDSASIGVDKTRGLLLSDSGEEDPFDTSHIPPSLAEPPNPPPVLVHPAPASSTPPPVPLRHSSSSISTVDSSSSSPHIPLSSPPPSSPPPPAPSLPSVSTPPLPSRTVNKPKVVNDSNANCHAPPSDLFSSDAAPANTSFMLPSPDEPPPPLPSHVNLTPSSSVAPPPPPPRPKLNSNSLPSPPVRHNGHEASLQKFNVISKRPHASSEISSPKLSDLKGAVKDNTESHTLDIADNQKQVSQKHCDAKPKFCDIVAPVEPSTAQNSSEKSVDLCKISSLKNHENINDLESTGKLVTNKFGWVDFEKSEPLEGKQSDVGVSESNSIEEKDPFNMPLHLTPGFKAVAKYGNDPFDDSLSGSFSNSHDKWDPFASAEHGSTQQNHGSFVSSPFADAFDAVPEPKPEPQSQAVNGNITDSHSLMD